MIFLNDILQQLSVGEASQLHIVDLITKQIDGDGTNKVITCLNACLEDLSIRFNLGEEERTVKFTAGKLTYNIKKENGVSVNPNGYILDTDDPMQVDALEIVAITDLHGRSYPLNNGRTLQELSELQARKVSRDNLVDYVKPFMSPKYGVVRVPPNFDGDYFVVRYKANTMRVPHIKVDSAGSALEDVSDVVIDLPAVFETAIVYYITMRLMSPRGTERAGQQVYSESSSYYAKYISECDHIHAMLNNNSTTADSITAFEHGGWP